MLQDNTSKYWSNTGPFSIKTLLFSTSSLAWRLSLGEGRDKVRKQKHVKQKCAQSLSHVLLFATPWTTAWQAPLCMGILQARILEWVGMLFSRGSSQPRNQTQAFHIAGRFFTSWATREACKTEIPEKKCDRVFLRLSFGILLTGERGEQKGEK